MSKVYVLGGAQTDFERNWKKEGKNMVALLKEVVADGFADAGITLDDVKELNKDNKVACFVGNFIAEKYTEQGHLGAFLTEVDPAFYGVPSARYEAACASSSVAIDAAQTKIMADEYDLAIVVGWELMKTVDSKLGGDFLGRAAYYKKEGEGIDLPFPKLFGKLADETLKKYSQLDEKRYMDKIYSALFESTDEIIESSSDTDSTEESSIVIPNEKPDYTYKYEESIFDEYKTSQALVQWIENGIYNQEQLTIDLKELLEEFKPKEKSIIEMFLSSRIMSMEWTTFIDGYKEALKEAYAGNLSSEQLLDFIVKIYKAKQLGLPIGDEQDCDEPDYSRMESAYNQRNKSNEQEPLLGGSDGPVEENAKALRLLIKSTISNRLIDQRCNEYYNMCLAFFKSPEKSNSPCMGLSDSIQVCLDNEMMESIFSAFKVSTNSTRMKIERVFSNIRFSEYRTNQMAPILIQKLEELDRADELDPIGRANLQELINSIKEKFGIGNTGTVA